MILSADISVVNYRHLAQNKTLGRAAACRLAALVGSMMVALGVVAALYSTVRADPVIAWHGETPVVAGRCKCAGHALMFVFI